MSSSFTKINHLFWRAGFGPTADMLFQTTPFKADTYFDALLTASSKKVLPILVSKNAVDGLANGLGELGRMNKLSEEERKQQRQQKQRQSRENIRNLNLEWLEEMVNTPAQLREKMSLFWHGHFACRNLNSYFQQDLLQVIREQALGNFGSLLRSVSKTPAMLAFLNNQQNRKEKPNENFAREVMELFTMGRGHYTEKDIREAAKAFTGWGFDGSGEFVFRRFAHDNGTKTVLGKTGNFDGDQVIDILLERRETARFIAGKLYRFLVNEIPDAEKVSWLADRFYKTGYEITPLLQDIFTSKWFYEPANMGNRIKGPVEWWVGLRRMIPMDIDNPDIQLLFQRALGQVLFYPPNVAGWPGGTNWIDSNALLLRMRLPQLVATADNFDIQAKSDDDVDMGRTKDGMGDKISNRFRIRANIQWEKMMAPFLKLPAKNRYDELANALFQTARKPHRNLLEPYAGNTEHPAWCGKMAVLMMSTPEYQLC